MDIIEKQFAPDSLKVKKYSLVLRKKTVKRPLIARAATYFFLVSIVVSMTSCFSLKKIALFQDAVDAQSFSEQENKTRDSIYKAEKLKIQPFDVLDVKVNSSLKALGLLTESQQNAFIDGATGTYFTGFLVDQEGYINLPLVGKVSVSGLSINEAKELLKTKLQAYLTEPFVDVKFLSFRVTVLGEVRRPGAVIVPNEKANLLEALSLTGDLTDFGNRQNIKVLRGDPQHPTVYIVDVTKISNYASNLGFKLMPNDIIYVEPLKRKFFAVNFNTALASLSILNTAALVWFRLKPE